MQVPKVSKQNINSDFWQKNTGIGKSKKAIWKFIKKLENFAILVHKIFALLLQNMGYNTIVTTKKTFFSRKGDLLWNIELS